MVYADTIPTAHSSIKRTAMVHNMSLLLYKNTNDSRTHFLGHNGPRSFGTSIHLERSTSGAAEAADPKKKLEILRKERG